MKEPLNQFADRLINNGEVKEFIQGLINKGVSPHKIILAMEKEDDKMLAAAKRGMERAE
jgi:hypothetical protein